MGLPPPPPLYSPGASRLPRTNGKIKKSSSSPSKSNDCKIHLRVFFFASSLAGISTCSLEVLQDTPIRDLHNHYLFSDV